MAQSISNAPLPSERRDGQARGEAPAAAVLPVFALINLVLAVGLVVGWARLLGHTRPERRPRRARLMREVGAVVYGQPYTPARES